MKAAFSGLFAVVTALLVTTASAFAQNTLSVQSKSGDPGLKGSIVGVSLTNTDAVGAIEFLIVDTSNNLTPTGARIGADLAGSGFQIDSQVFDPDTIKVVLISTSGDTLPAGESVVVEILYDVADGDIAGETADLLLKEVVLADPRAEELDFTAEDGEFRIVNTPVSTLSIASDTTTLGDEVTLAIGLDNADLTEDDRQVSGLEFTIAKQTPPDVNTPVSFSDILQYLSIKTAGRAASAGFTAQAQATGDGVEVTLTHPEGAALPPDDGPIAEITFKTAQPGTENLAFTDVFISDEDTLALPEGEHGSGFVLVNQAPVALDDSIETDEDPETAVAIAILGNDIEPDGDEFTVTLLLDNTTGTVEFDDDDDQAYYTAPENFNGEDQFSYILTDPYGVSDTATVLITVNPVNDAPTAVAPTEQATNEDEPIVFSSSNNNAISVDDTENNQNNGSTAPTTLRSTGTPTQVSIAITPDDDDEAIGTLSVPNASDDLTVTGDETDSLTLTGSVADINSALDGLTYTPGENKNGSEKLTIIVDDMGDGTNPALFDTAEVALTVDPVNDAPIIGAPDSLETDEDVPVIFSAENNNALTIADADADETEGAELEVTLTAGSLLTLGSTEDIEIIGGADSSNSVTFTGSLDAINNALDGLVYTPPQDVFGADQLDLLVNDNGATGGSGEGDDHSVFLTINSVNDLPVALDDSTITEEDASVDVFVLINDSDLESGELTVTEASDPEHGETEISEDQTFVIYTPDEDYNGTDSFWYVVADSDGGLDTTTVKLTVTPVNDAPVVRGPETEETDEDKAITFNEDNKNAIAIEDGDADETEDAELTVTLTAGSTVTLGSTEEIEIIGGEDGSHEVVFTGSLDAINNALDGLVYTPTKDISGDGFLSINVNDNGATGPEDESGDLTVAITINPVNDPPVIVSGDPPAAVEDAKYLFQIEAEDLEGDAFEFYLGSGDPPG